MDMPKPRMSALEIDENSEFEKVKVCGAALSMCCDSKVLS
jgi:hypothetical protein